MLQKYFEELDAITGAKLIIPDPSNIQNFTIRIIPVEGIWRGGKFDFEFTVPDDFPYDRPRVKCATRIWHPNIEETGAVCLNILRENYTPVIGLAHLVVGLQSMFTDVNPASPLNKEAAVQFEKDYNAFVHKAQEYMRQYCPH